MAANTRRTARRQATDPRAEDLKERKPAVAGGDRLTSRSLARYTESSWGLPGRSECTQSVCFRQ